MAYISREKILEREGNIYKLVLLASKRALELSEGATPLSPKNESGKFTSLALKEIEEGKVYIKGEEKEAKPKAKKGKG